MFVAGPIASGKSTKAHKLALAKNAYFVEISDIVKEILNAKERTQLQDHPELDKAIIEKIKLLSEQHSNKMVVSGVRQASILKAFLPTDTKDLTSLPLYLWVEVDEEERFRRYMNRKDSKDILSREAFQKAQEADNRLGLQEVKSFCQEFGATVH